MNFTGTLLLCLLISPTSLALPTGSLRIVSSKQHTIGMIPEKPQVWGEIPFLKSFFAGSQSFNCLQIPFLSLFLLDLHESPIKIVNLFNINHFCLNYNYFEGQFVCFIMGKPRL